MKEFLESMVKQIVDKPDEVKVEILESDSTKIFELTVGEGDIGMVIGKRGKNVGALRTLLSAANAKTGDKRAILEIIE
ncbi:MAG: KH domain-containing protein [Candidatus Marinimicrobia bacterium]|nr:KH domain-containing protein [Candidatus Neomarinimicrobiota bacterium]MBL7023268.1 KH domain-containing protein [Candidatus Neomarinimicrobiota bacterium]MBL7108862.1 KH domain-containing protein [Candidatus Neomarinimicrobiota bacterium]